jgi:hypothetical protein
MRLRRHHLDTEAGGDRRYEGALDDHRAEDDHEHDPVDLRRVVGSAHDGE